MAGVSRGGEGEAEEGRNGREGEDRRGEGRGGGSAGAVTWMLLLCCDTFQGLLVAAGTLRNHPSEGYSRVPQHPLCLGCLALLDGLIDGSHTKSH